MVHVPRRADAARAEHSNCAGFFRDAIDAGVNNNTRRVEVAHLPTALSRRTNSTLRLLSDTDSFDKRFLGRWQSCGILPI